MRGRKRRRLESRFPPSLFALYLLILLLMSGIHTGLITLSNEYEWNAFIQIILPITYWSLVAVGLTVFTRHQIAKTYDHPMKELAKAAQQVAQGDFSVYIPPLHTSNRYDYLDLMFLDFNKMVAELGSLETMRTDFIANVSHEIKTPLATIQNYAQLLQNFDSCVAELKALERDKTTPATITALIVGILGTAFMAGAIFAAVAEPPIVWRSILLAIPGFLGWIVPYFLYRALTRKWTAKVEPLMEQKYDEINSICEKGTHLLH